MRTTTELMCQFRNGRGKCQWKSKPQILLFSLAVLYSSTSGTTQHVPLGAMKERFIRMMLQKMIMQTQPTYDDIKTLGQAYKKREDRWDGKW